MICGKKTCFQFNSKCPPFPFHPPPRKRKITARISISPSTPRKHQITERMPIPPPPPRKGKITLRMSTATGVSEWSGQPLPMPQWPAMDIRVCEDDLYRTECRPQLIIVK
jgi:hypothetical protein